VRIIVVFLVYGLLANSYCDPAVARGGGSVHVRGYYRKDGTFVEPHYRSAPDSDPGNNWSTKGNFNPYTGKDGVRATPTLPLQSPSPALTKGNAGQPPVMNPHGTIETEGPNVRPSSNFDRCLSEPSPPGCNRSVLTPGQARQVREAEAQRNFRRCLSDTEPSVCMKGMLNLEQARQVREAEAQRNFGRCLSDPSPPRCDRSVLTPEQARQVQGAEAQRNFKRCLSDTDPSMCIKGMLTSDQARQVRAAEAQRQGPPGVVGRTTVSSP
jgi:hypothetical protein